MEDLRTQLVCIHKRFYCPIAALARPLQDATQEYWNNWLRASVYARTLAGLIAGRNQTLVKLDRKGKTGNNSGHGMQPGTLNQAVARCDVQST
jgi:hypothetical protein